MNYSMAKALLLIFILPFWCFTANAQERSFTLQEALCLVQETHGYRLAVKDSLINDLRHKVFKGSIKPNIQLTMKLPEYDKSISLVSQYDGSYKYRSRTYATSSLNVDASQLIPLTGGTLRYSIGLNRLDNLTNDDKTHAYYLNLSRLSYSQNLFAFNAYKWAKRQDLQEQIVEGISNRQEREKARYEIVEAFFDLLIQQQSKEVNKRNLMLSRYVYEKSKVLLCDRRISEPDYLDAEIEYMRDSIYNNETDINAARIKFRDLLRLPPGETPCVIFEDSLIAFRHLDFDASEILSRCLRYGFDESYNLKEIQQKIEIKKAKAEISPLIQLEMGGGYNTQFESFGHALDDRLASRSISLSVSIPLYNGGTLKNKYRISQIQMQKLKEQREYDKAVATADIVRDLYNINIIIESINNYRETLRLLNVQMANVKLAMDYGRINMEQYIRLKSQYSQSYMAYLTLIKSYYICIYKYRYLALFDIESNEEL
ncbi:MAG: TolC family protein [Prevotella sp.]|nr:TolC family protein [Prevotella sp.]